MKREGTGARIRVFRDAEMCGKFLLGQPADFVEKKNVAAASALSQERVLLPTG
jgi:hypothetical protein